MRASYWRIFFLSLFLGPLSCVGDFSWGIEGGGNGPSAPSLFRTHLKQGIEKIFDLDEQGGIAELVKAMELDKNSPTGAACLSAAYLFFYEMSYYEKERAQNEESMLLFAKEALSKGGKQMELNPADGNANFAMAIATLVKLRYDMNNQRYLAVAQDAQETMNFLEKAREFDPGNMDINFPSGLLRYHLGHLNGFTRFLAYLFIPPGRSRNALQELELAAEKGVLFRELAQAELLSVYANFEKRPERALPLARDLKKKFPHNYNFSFTLANILSDLNNPEEALSVALEIENGIKSGKPPFRPELWPRYYQLRGKICFDQGEYIKAADFFKRVIQDRTSLDARVQAWALVRLGMIYDILKDRNTAESYYRRALVVKGGEGVAQISAQQYLKNPYVPDEKKGKSN